MSLSPVMMDAPQPPVTAITMKLTLMNTTTHARPRTHRRIPFSHRIHALNPGAASDGTDVSSSLPDSGLQAPPSTDRTGA